MKQKLFLALLLTLMLAGPFGSFLDIPQVKASPDMLPTNGDAWTENDNATYTWKFHTSYMDTMAWTTTDVHEGTYALNVTHTKASTNIYFRLILDQNYDVSSYDGILFWMKATSADSSYTIKVYMNPTDTNWDATNNLVPPLAGTPNIDNATWTRIFIPLMVFDVNGNANFTLVRQIYFTFTAVGSADNTEILIDNLHFTTFTVAGQTPTTDQLKMMSLTYYNMKLGQHLEEVDSVNYTTMYDWQNLTDNTLDDGTLETEVLGQNIFALSLAYEETGFSFYLTEAERIVQMLLQAQEQNAIGVGGFHNGWTGSAWNEKMGSVYNGWIMAGLSQLYGVTSNSTYKTAVDLQRNYLTGIMWNDTLNIFNVQFSNNTQLVSYATGSNPMREGACTIGLATYYRYVEQNTTVLDRLDKALNKILSTTTPYVQSMVYSVSKWEDNAYQMWGMWQAWKATSNTTYRDSFLNVSKILVGSYMKNPSLNGSATKQVGWMYGWAGSGNYMDGWGLHNSIPLMFLANEIEAQTYFINTSELSLFNHLRLTQDDEGAFQRDSSTYWDLQYYGTPSFVVLGSQLYHLNKATDLYVPASTGKIANISTTTETMTLTVDGTGTTTTYVYIGSRGEPTSVSGATSSYDSATSILTLTVTHSSLEEVVIDWSRTIPASLVTLVRSNYYLVFGLISITPIIMGAVLIVTLIKGKQTLDPNEIIALIGMFATLVVAFIVIWNIMNALIGA